MILGKVRAVPPLRPHNSRPHDDAVIARRVLVRGFVQGVYFRESCRREAERLGVAGSIENLHDGRVLGRFEGPAGAVDALVDWCHEGPDRARVEGVEVEHDEPSGAEGFAVR